MATTGQKVELLAGKALNGSIQSSPIVRYRDVPRAQMNVEEREGLPEREWLYYGTHVS
jgi:hypothetical protein